LAAAHLYGLVKGSPPTAEVTAPTERRIEGVRIHRARVLDAHDVATFRGISVTTVPRTLVDIAAALSPEALARACHEAGVRYRTTPSAVEAVLARRPTSPGARKLHARGPISRSPARRRAPASHHQPPRRGPSRRLSLAGAPLTVELDGYRFHNSRYSWEQDRRREREARQRGDEFRRYSYADVTEHPRFMLTDLRSLLPPSEHPG
jgi:hypothetical protein